jgi:hypothetical protein
MTATAPTSRRFRPGVKAMADGAGMMVLIPAMAIFPLLALTHPGVLSTAQPETSGRAGRGLPFWARPATAWALASLAVLLAAAMIPLSITARQNPLAQGNATNVVVAGCFAVVGLVLAWHRPRNPIGWLMLALGAGLLFTVDAGLYNVIGYRLDHRLPLGPAVLFLFEVSQPELGLLPLIILLFPDGRLPSPRWRWLLYGYLAVGLADTIVFAQVSVDAITHHRTEVDTSGTLIFAPHASQLVGVAAGLVFAMWALAVGYQVMSWRRAVGERRQQLNWLMAGGAAALALTLAEIAAVAVNHPLFLPHSVRLVVGAVLAVGLAALPVGMGVAILEYRLYDIDRIVSRTLAYAIVTGLLVGVYAGLVLLATEVLQIKSAVAVAGSTLVAAALFSPLRSRVQRIVDRRFNRTRYDADQMVAAFAARLKDAVDSDAVQADLASMIQRALEPPMSRCGSASSAKASSGIKRNSRPRATPVPPPCPGQ